MVWFIIILIVVCVLSSPSANHQQHYEAPRKLSKHDRKRIQRTRDRSEMDTWEDMMMYYEVFADDDF